MVDAIEVTDEMLRGGLAYWEANKRSATMPQLVDGMFRAMRALEPVPEPLKFGRQTAYRPEFAGEAQFAPDPRGRLFSDTVAARKAVDPEFREALEAEVGPAAPKFCKDCRWMESMSPGISWNAGPRCLQRLGRDWNLVTGEGTQPHCVYARMQSEKCGSDARWFEPGGASDA